MATYEEARLYWTDFAIRRSVTDAELAAAVAEVFGVPVAAVKLAALTSDMLEFGLPAPDVAVRRSPVGGDFALWVELMPMRERPQDGLPRLARLARALRSDCLAPGYSVEEGWLLVHEDGTVESVEVDDFAIDDGKYIIVESEPPSSEVDEEM